MDNKNFYRQSHNDDFRRYRESGGEKKRTKQIRRISKERIQIFSVNKAMFSAVERQLTKQNIQRQFRNVRKLGRRAQKTKLESR